MKSTNNTRSIRGGIAIALASVALIAAGCGSDDEGGSDSPEGAVSTLYSAVADGDASKACGSLTENAQQELIDSTDADDCEAAMQTTIDSGFNEFFEDVEVGEATIDGDSATVAITLAGDDDEVEVLNEDGVWRVDEGT